MADVIRKSTNKFTKGLIMDFSPENTQKEVLTHALNATLLTFNGNEMSLQNDMGNARVETAYLPEGYMPVGTCEYGGVIYIVSYNPLEDKSQIGCFPSPERNVSRHELGEAENVQITVDKFQKTGIDETSGKEYLTGDILNTTQYVLLKNDNLNPGDKFLICANKSIYDEKLENLLVHRDLQGNQTPSQFEPIENPILALNVVSIEDSGKVIYLNNDIRDYTNINTYTDLETNTERTDAYKYHIVGKGAEGSEFNQELIDPDTYRDVLNSGYSVFKSKTSGKLAILAELIMIDSYNVTHSLVPKKTESGEIIDGAFDLVIHTEVTPDVTEVNYKTVPKLQYYYLKESQGFIDNYNKDNESTPIPMFNDRGDLNTVFYNYELAKMYVPTDESLSFGTNTLGNAGKFNFPKSDTYHSYMHLHPKPIEGVAEDRTYTKFTEGKYHRVILNQIPHLSYFTDKLQAKFYSYQGGNKDLYLPWTDRTLNSAYTYYIKEVTYEYTNAQRNFIYSGRDLFKMLSEPTSATIKEIENVEIEKFQYANIFSVRQATMEDYEKGTTLYEKKDDSYVQITSVPQAGVTYYVLKEERVLVSIGFDIIREEHPGEIFYYPTEKSYIAASTSDLATYWDFTTYPFEAKEPYGCPIMLYYRDEIVTYRLATTQELLNFTQEDIKLYYSADYVHITKDELQNTFKDKPIYVVVPIDAYASKAEFVPDLQYNYISGCEEESEQLDPDYPVGDPLILYKVADFIPTTNFNSDDWKPYNDIILANIQIPAIVTANGLDLPFRYNYTLVPCMNYGRLDHLAVSNTVDFSKLHAFNQSDFTTWKYHIDGSQVRLTFGAEIYDTYEAEDEKVSGLFLEFYDVWGFAGSIEIVDKKSYSGLFTKLISLNTRGALSTNKINGKNLEKAFKRNINIQSAGVDKFTCNGKDVGYVNDYEGWSNIDDNDCGTLYPNIIYTVKTYIKRAENGEVKYIPKREFFLYTLPIFNDYYYTITDFSNIEFPQLDLMMTYKLQDSSSQVLFNKPGETEQDTIIKGYYQQDNELLSKYSSGSMSSTSSINSVKYINYVGQSNLFLEIGLKQEYQSLGLSYTPEINNLFSCELELVNDEGSGAYLVTSNSKDLEAMSSEVLLNYYHKDNVPLTLDVNTFGFADGSTKLPIAPGQFNNYNFLYGNYTSIPIKYSFVVGYPIHVSNIRKTEIQALTICALCHKDDSGEYNYPDFGIYECANPTGSSESWYLSDKMFYNGGTMETERVGLCRLIDPTASCMPDQCVVESEVESEAQVITNAGHLNTGDPLKQLIPDLGKLAFCQPHAHSLRSDEGVNIHGDAEHQIYTIPPEDGGWTLREKNAKDTTWGILPWWYLYNNPKYNMCVNTKNMINYQSEFISAVDCKISDNAYMLGYNTDSDKDRKTGWLTWKNVKAREYAGFTGLQIETFNRKLLQTMKNVYAYNPDYDSLTMYSGDVAVTNNNVKFTSNIISSKAKLTFSENESLNNYIYFGNIKVSDYIQYMWKHSSTDTLKRVKVYVDSDAETPTTKPQITFDAGLSYCGEEGGFLVSNLTYDTSRPSDISSEWALSVSNPVVVRKENGEYTIIHGTPNKKALYGFNEDAQKLVELDVSNYTINDDGSLVVSDRVKSGLATGSANINSSNVSELLNGNIFNFSINSEEDSNVEVQLKLNQENDTFLKLNESKNKIYFMKNHPDSSSYLELQLTTNIPETADGDYRLSSVNVTGTITGKMLRTDIFTTDGYGTEYSSSNFKIGLRDQSEAQLANLVSNSSLAITLNKRSGSAFKTSNTSCWTSDNKSDHVVYINDNLTFGSSTTGKYRLKFSDTLARGVGLYELKITKITCTFNKTKSITLTDSDVIPSAKTYDYFEKVNHKYTVKQDYNNARIRGTSFTINDLIYEPSENHRLFVNSARFEYDPYLRNKLYYRTTNGALNTSQHYYQDDYRHPSWTYGSEGVKHKNTLFFYTGPCFTDDNL